MEIGNNYPESNYSRKTLHLRMLPPIWGLIGTTCLHKIDFIQGVITYNIKNSKTLSGFWDCGHYYTSSTSFISSIRINKVNVLIRNSKNII